jgi:hypothetical protein
MKRIRLISCHYARYFHGDKGPARVGEPAGFASVLNISLEEPQVVYEDGEATTIYEQSCLEIAADSQDLDVVIGALQDIRKAMRAFEEPTSANLDRPRSNEVGQDRPGQPGERGVDPGALGEAT